MFIRVLQCGGEKDCVRGFGASDAAFFICCRLMADLLIRDFSEYRRSHNDFFGFSFMKLISTFNLGWSATLTRMLIVGLYLDFSKQPMFDWDTLRISAIACCEMPSFSACYETLDHGAADLFLVLLQRDMDWFFIIAHLCHIFLRWGGP